MKYPCSKCNKGLSSKQNLLKHEDKCNGLKSTQCELCHKDFSSVRTKYQHKKGKVCENNGTIIDNKECNIRTQNNHNQIETQNNIENQTINNYHIHLHLGNENMEYLSEELKENFWLEYLNPEKLKQFHKDLHFNPEHPENHTISKTDLYRNEYHVKLKSGVLKIKFDELYDLLIDLYNKVGDAPLCPIEGDWTYDSDNSSNVGDENTAQRKRHEQQFKKNIKLILYNLSKENPTIAKKLQMKSVEKAINIPSQIN